MRRPSSASARLLGLVTVAAALLLTACVDRVSPTALARAGRAMLAIEPAFPSRAEGTAAIPLSRATATLVGPNGERFTAQARFAGDSAILEFDVPITGGATIFALTVTVFDLNGTEVYSATQQIRVTPGSAPSVASPQLVYSAPDAAVRTVRMTPATLALNAGASGTLVAEGFNASNQPVALLHLGWTSRDPSIATVDATGTVIAGQFQGSTWVVVRTQTGLADSARVSVRAPVHSVTVTPRTLTLARGQSGSIAAATADVGGRPITDRTITWTSTDPSRVTVSATGAVQAIAVGAARIAATSEGRSDTAVVTVISPVERVDVSPAAATLDAIGRTRTLAATIVARSGASVAGITATWASNRPEVATVDANGVVTARSNGQATITASAEGQSGSATVTVAQVPAAVQINPKAEVLTAFGQQATFSATVTDGAGQPIASPTLVWSSSNIGIATVNSSGRATSTGIGQTRIIVQAGTAADTAILTVRQVPVGVDITADRTELDIGQTVQLAGYAVDEANTRMDGLVAYTSQHPTIATVTPSGLVTAVGSGQATIMGTSRGVSGVIVITVRGPVGPLTLNVTTIERLPGGTQQFSVTAGGAGPFIWSVNGVDGGNATIGLITATGLYTAPQAVPTPPTVEVCARRSTAPAERGCATVTIRAVPTGGADVIVFNDVNLFDSHAAQNPNNQRFYQNLVSFTGTGPRVSKTAVLLSTGHGSQYLAFEGLEGVAQQGGMTVDRLPTDLPSVIDAKYKVVVLALPTRAYPLSVINALKAFAAEGGRIIFVGEHAGFYSGISVQNDFLLKMGAKMTNTGGAFDCGYNTLPASALRPHQVMDGLTNLTMACASAVVLGPNDYALFYSLDGQHVLGAVAKVDVTPIIELNALRAGRLGVQVPTRALPVPMNATVPRSNDPVGRDMPGARKN